MVTQNINEVGGPWPIRSVDVKPTERPADTPHATAPEGAARNEVAPELQQQSRLQEAAKLVFDSLPEARKEKIELARRRLQMGYYDQPPVKERIAARILNDPDVLLNASLTPELREEIERRLEAHHYDNPEAREKIAGGILEDAAES